MKPPSKTIKHPAPAPVYWVQFVKDCELPQGVHRVEGGHCRHTHGELFVYVWGGSKYHCDQRTDPVRYGQWVNPDYGVCSNPK